MKTRRAGFAGGGPRIQHHGQLPDQHSYFNIRSRGSICAPRREIFPACIFAFCSPIVPLAARCFSLLPLAPMCCRAKLCRRHVARVSRNTGSPLVTAGRHWPSDLGSPPFYLGAAAALAHHASLTRHLRPGARACVSAFASYTKQNTHTHKHKLNFNRPAVKSPISSPFVTNQIHPGIQVSMLISSQKHLFCTQIERKQHIYFSTYCLLQKTLCFFSRLQLMPCCTSHMFGRRQTRGSCGVSSESLRAPGCFWERRH